MIIEIGRMRHCIHPFTPYHTSSGLINLRYGSALMICEGSLGYLMDQVRRKQHPEVRPAVLALLEEYPHYDKNCFVIMPFRNTAVHSEIFDVISSTLTGCGLTALRADTKIFSDDLFLNILAYLHGCKFGIAVFERVLTQDFNPNVSLEVGYLLGLRKPVLLLKDQTLPRLPSDLVGRLYTEFNTFDVKGTLPAGIQHWLVNKKLLKRDLSTNP